MSCINVFLILIKRRQSFPSIYLITQIKWRLIFIASDIIPGALAFAHESSDCGKLTPNSKHALSESSQRTFELWIIQIIPSHNPRKSYQIWLHPGLPFLVPQY